MRTREMLARARRYGKDAGAAAADWATDFGRMTQTASRQTAERILRALADNDSAVLDSFRIPNLSGEYADDPTPATLAEDCGLDPDDSRAEWLTDELSSAWEEAAGKAFWRELERACRAELSA